MSCCRVDVVAFIVGAEYMTNRIGDRGKPCGSPDSNPFGVSVSPLKSNESVRLVQKSWIHQVRYVGNPAVVISSLSLLCRTVLKAPSMSLARRIGRRGCLLW